MPVDTAVEHAQWGPGAVISGEPDRVTVLFGEYGYRTFRWNRSGKAAS